MSEILNRNKRRGAYKTKSYEEKCIGLRYYFERNLTVEEVADTIDSTAHTVRGWLRKIDYNFDNIERLRIKRKKRKDRSNIHLELEEWVQKEI